MIFRYNVSVLAGIYLKTCDVHLEKGSPSLSLSPCYFRMLGKDIDAEKNGIEIPQSHKNHIETNKLTRTASDAFTDTMDWLIHNEVINFLSDESHDKANEEVANQSENQNGLQHLLRLWYNAQLDAITSFTGMEVNALVLGGKTLLHFEVSYIKLGTNGKVQLASNSLENRKRTAEILFLLIIGEDSVHHGKLNAYEVALGERNKLGNNQADVQLFKSMKFGDPLSFQCIEDRISEEQINSEITSLGWMEATVSDVINSRYLSACQLIHCSHQFLLRKTLNDSLFVLVLS